MSRSRARSRGWASALQGVEGRSMTLTLCPAMAVSGPIHSLPGEQAGWTDGWGVWLRTDPQSRLPSNQGEVATLLTEGSRVPSPLAILFCLLLPLFFFFLPSPDAGVGRGGDLFPIGFRRLEQDLCFSKAKRRWSALGQAA